MTSRRTVRWASEEARLRGLPLRLVHAWHEPLDVSVDLDATDVPGYDGPAESRAEHGRAAAVLLAQDADVLVLGGHANSPHIAHVSRLCLHRSTCPVVVVPDIDDEQHDCVVVGVDPSPAAAAALHWASEEAALRDARLVVVHAFQSRSDGSERQARITDWVTSVLGPRVSAEIRVEHGAPLDTLFRYAADADLAVLGRGTHHGLGRILHEAVADDLSGIAPCPIVVVPPPTH